MKKPYRINFHSNTLSDENINYNLSKNCRYPVLFARAKQFIIPQANLLMQYSSTYLSYAELYEINVKENFSASIEIIEQKLFLFFMLEGSIT